MKSNLVLAAFFAILTGVGAQISIPLPGMVPFTMQTMVVLMSGLLLGPKYGPASQLLYMAMGLVGLPVFSGGTGGIQSVLSPSFGFIPGFVFASWVAGAVMSRSVRTWNTPRRAALVSCAAACILASVAIYVVGIPLFLLNMNYITNVPMNVGRALQLAMLPFAVTDVIKAVAAGALALGVMRLMRGAGERKRCI
ncbi:MAG: biotin transporter BioY [Synergistaceae bacterium]|nr:biotin transporter BioY [Synergistaceae bacterium]